MNEELLRLTRENNEMLKRIVAYIEKVESPEYIDQKAMCSFAMNLAADFATEMMSNYPRSPLSGIGAQFAK